MFGIGSWLFVVGGWLVLEVGNSSLLGLGNYLWCSMYGSMFAVRNLVRQNSEIPNGRNREVPAVCQLG